MGRLGTLSLEVAKAPTKPTRPAVETAKGIEAREARRRQARFHRQVLAHDGQKCTKCGRRREELTGTYPDHKKMIADHITPKKYGGSDEVSNGQTHCFFCDVYLGFGWQNRYKQAERPETEEEFARRRAAFFAEEETS